MRWIIVLLWLLSGCAQAQETPRPAESPAAPPRAASRLTWAYLHPAPDTFVIERRLADAVTWQELAALPGATGEALAYTDTTLAPTTTPQVVQYRVTAVKANIASVPTAPVTTTIPAVSPTTPSLACTVTQVTATAVTITCPLVAPTR